MATHMQTVGTDVNGQEIHVQVLNDCIVSNDPNLMLEGSSQEASNFEMGSPESLDKQRRRIKKPLMALSVREKTAICRYKAEHPDSNQRVIAEHFTELWGKEICRRRVSDILLQKKKWFDVERRVRGDADKTFRDGKFSSMEKALFEWVYRSFRQGDRITETHIKEKASEIAAHQECKSFVPSISWIAGFRKRYSLNFDGDVVSGAAFVDEEFMRDENQLHLHGSDGQAYTVNITVDDNNIPSTNPPQTLSLHGGLSRAPERVSQSDADTGDSGDEDDLTEITVTQSQQNPLNPNMVNGDQNLALDEIVKNIIYGAPSSSSQTMAAAASQSVTSSEQYYNDGDTGTQPKSRMNRRSKLTAVLVRKVLASTKRKLDAETDMIKEQKQRHYYEGKMFEERRKRLIEERELLAAQRRKLDAEAKFLQEQQRNEIIRRELLLADVAAVRAQSPKASRVHSATPVQVSVPQNKTASYITVVAGSSE